MSMSYLCGFLEFPIFNAFLCKAVSSSQKLLYIYTYAILLIFHLYFFKIIFKNLTLAFVSFFIWENSEDFIPYTAISTL